LIAIIAAVVVVVVVVLAAVLLSGILSSGGGGSGATTLESSTDALALANTGANGIAGGPWYLTELAGLSLTSAYTNSTGIPVPTGCSSLESSTISVAAYNGIYTTGKLESWLAVYLNGGGTEELAMYISGGPAKEVGLVGGTGCSFGHAGSAISANVNSTAAAAAALGTVNISTFARNEPTANAEFFLTDLSADQGAWLILYTTCDFVHVSGGPSVGSSALAYVNASSGLVVSSYYSAAQNCTNPFPGGPGPTKIPIGTAFAAGNPVEGTCPVGDSFATNGCFAGHYTYTLTIEASAVKFGDVLFGVRTATGGIYQPTGPGGFSVVSITGSVAAQTGVGSGSVMNMGIPFTTFGPGVSVATPLTSLYAIVLDVGTANPTGTGLTFVVTGTGNYTGTTAPLALP
jgi:hypothetical protein